MPQFRRHLRPNTAAVGPDTCSRFSLVCNGSFADASGQSMGAKRGAGPSLTRCWRPDRLRSPSGARSCPRHRCQHSPRGHTALPPAQGRERVTSGTPPPARAGIARARPASRESRGLARPLRRAPSALSVTTRPYQSARGAHRWERRSRGLGLGTAPTVWALGLRDYCGDGSGAAEPGRESWAVGKYAGFDCSGLAMAPLLPPAMAPRVPAPLLSVSESGRRRRPSARSRRLLLSSSTGAILARQESRAPRGRRQAEPSPATRGKRPGEESRGTSPGDTPSPPPPLPPR